MSSTCRPVRRTCHLDLTVPGYVSHPAFRTAAAAKRHDPTELLASPIPPGNFMPDEASRDHSKRMHYAAHRMHTARTRRELRKWQQAYLQLRNRIVVGNRKLIYRAVQSFATASQQIEDLAAECHIILIHAVVAFNPWIGIRFSTYAYTCLLRALSRMGKRASKDVARRAVPLESFIESEPPRSVAATPANHQFRVEEFLKPEHPLLSEREKKVIVKRFNLNEQSEKTTLEDVGQELGLSKERVRQVQASAILKLRKALTVSP